MSAAVIEQIDRICTHGIVRDVDVPELRRLLVSADAPTDRDIEALLRLHHGTRSHDAAWCSFFIDALCDFVINELPPQGYITADNATWLIRAIAPKGRVETASEIELLIVALERARWVPEGLVRFALDQVRAAVIDAAGPLRAGIDVAPRTVTPADVSLIHRILLAFGTDGCIPITRAEAEVLFEIEEATAEQEQPVVWRDLFTKAMACIVMTASGYRMPTRQEVLRIDNWLVDRPNLSRHESLSRTLMLFRLQDAHERALSRLERQRVEIITSAEVSDGSASWLASRLGTGGTLTAAQRDVLTAIRRARRVTDTVLQPLFEVAGH